MSDWLEIFWGEILSEDEMQIAVERVTVDHPFGIAVLAHQVLEVDRGVGETLDRKGDVLDEHRRSRLAHAADRRENALADVPQPLALGRIEAEARRFLGQRSTTAEADISNARARLLNDGSRLPSLSPYAARRNGMQGSQA